MAKKDEKWKQNMCAYCGGIGYYPVGTKRPDKVCSCTYRYMRMGSSGFSISNTSRMTTAASMRKEVERYLEGMKPDAPVAFMFSVTRLDEEKIAKSDAKREAQR